MAGCVGEKVVLVVRGRVWWHPLGGSKPEHQAVEAKMWISKKAKCGGDLRRSIRKNAFHIYVPYKLLLSTFKSLISHNLWQAIILLLSSVTLVLNEQWISTSTIQTRERYDSRSSPTSFSTTPHKKSSDWLYLAFLLYAVSWVYQPIIISQWRLIAKDCCF